MSNVSVRAEETAKVPESGWQERVLRAQNVAKREITDIVDGTGKIVIIDFIVGFFFIFRSVVVLSQPLSTLILLIYVIVRVFSTPRRTVPMANLFLVLIMFAFFYVGVASVLAGESTVMETVQRLVRMAAVVGLALFLGDGRIDIRSLVFGFSAGLIFNALGFYAGVAPADYGAYLTGWIQDKNVAGLYYALAPLLMFVLYSKIWQRVLIVLISLPLLWETGSRTSIGAFLIGVLWMLFAQKLNLFFKLALGLFVGWFFEWLQNNFADSALFGDRSGTDWFRQQIDNASWAKVIDAPWHGLGLGQAFAPVEGHNDQYFHNSYWTLYVEGGWPWTIAVIGISLLAVFIWKQAKSPRRLGAEAGMVLLAMCSWRLGEVILTMPWGLVIGIALSYLPSAIESKSTVDNFEKI